MDQHSANQHFLPVVQTNKTQTWQVSSARRRQWGTDRQTGKKREPLSVWTHSAVICVTSGREVKPEPRNESRYWVIFNAVSQSSTELTLLRSGAPRSNKGCEGLQIQKRDRVTLEKAVLLVQKAEAGKAVC